MSIVTKEFFSSFSQYTSNMLWSVTSEAKNYPHNLNGKYPLNDEVECFI